jgi:hypothetical protein
MYVWCVLFGINDGTHLFQLLAWLKDGWQQVNRMAKGDF